MLKIIVGLGNPGTEYEDTRHNAGFMLIDYMAEDQRFNFDKKFEAHILKSGDFLFVKPLTFMNNSGRAVRKIMDFFKLDVKNLILVHDDLDLKLGEYKIQTGVGPKVHNGVTSVEDCMVSKEFCRVRLGVNNRMNSAYEGSGADYVLSKFAKREMEIMKDVIEEVVDELLVTLSLKKK